MRTWPMLSWEAFFSRKSLPRSTDVVAVFRDCGLWKGLELVSEAVGVVEDMDQLRRLLERGGMTSGRSSVLSSDVRLFLCW